MILYYLLLALCLSQCYPTSFYWPTAYTYGTIFIFYWLPAYPKGSLLPSTGQLPIPTVPYHLLMTLCLSLLFSFNNLLTHCLYLWYYSTFYWLPVYPYGTVLLSTGSLLYLWYSTIFYCPTTNTYGILLSSTGPLPIPHFYHPYSTLLSSNGSLPFLVVIF